MELIEVQKLTKNKLGLRCKQEKDYILIYGNAYTLFVDICKWVKLKWKILNE